MNGNEKFLGDMRDALAAMMNADPYYADIEIITERLKDIEGKISEIVGRASGLAIVLVTPVVGGAMPNLKGANFNGILFVARVLENTKTNATGKDALDVAVYTAAFWSQLKPDALSAPFKLDEPPITLGNDSRFLSYDVHALTEGGMQIAIPKLAEIAIDASNLAAIAFTHPIAMATLVYTLDGSKPFPRNPSARPYVGPFNAAPGSTLRARAWLPGYIPSAEQRQQL